MMTDMILHYYIQTDINDWYMNFISSQIPWIPWGPWGRGDFGVLLATPEAGALSSIWALLILPAARRVEFGNVLRSQPSESYGCWSRAKQIHWLIVINKLVSWWNPYFESYNPMIFPGDSYGFLNVHREIHHEIRNQRHLRDTWNLRQVTVPTRSSSMMKPASSTCQIPRSSCGFYTTHIDTIYNIQIDGWVFSCRYHGIYLYTSMQHAYKILSFKNVNLSDYMGPCTLDVCNQLGIWSNTDEHHIIR